MKISDVPFTLTDWKAVKPTEHRGEKGTSYWRTSEQGNLRVRMTEYSSGFRADHWCPRGHVVLVLEGDIGLELRDGRTVSLGPGMSFQCGDDESNPHLAFSKTGAKAFVVD
jgi:hypothetical protein